VNRWSLAALLAAVQQVRSRGGLVIAQLNPNMPYTLGDSELDEELIDLAIEGSEDLLSPEAGPGHEHAERIADLVAGLVENGSTLQLGIGQVPDATLRALAGRSERAQARLTIEHAAHPDAREELRQYAATLGQGAAQAAVQHS
jgi:acyl-CoA hydrolase